MRRSCLVGLILVAAVLLAASFWLRQYLAPGPSTAKTPLPGATAAGPEASAPELLPTLPPPTAVVLPEDLVYEERIEGLYLEALQPLASVPLGIRGLAAADGLLYATAYDAGAQSAWLHELDRGSATVLRSLALYEQGAGEPCGVQAAGQLLWTCVNTSEGALILAVDRDAWAAAVWAPLTDTLRAIAQTPDGALVGMDAQGRRFYRWGPDGALQRVGTNATGALYTDCELVRGSLVCAGTEEGGAVLDVLDPESLSLLVRHRATTRTEWGTWVAGNGLAYAGDWFLLAPAGGEFPLVWSYRLAGGALADFVPSVRPPQ